VLTNYVNDNRPIPTYSSADTDYRQNGIGASLVYSIHNIPQNGTFTQNSS